MVRRMTPLLLLALASPLLAQTPPPLRAGLATTIINPPTPAWLVGFAARSHPATTLSLDLKAKALYLEQSPSRRALILTADLLGFTERITNTLAQRALSKHGLARHQLFFFASHTHSGPAVLDRLTLTVADSPAFHAEAEAYTASLIDKLDRLITQALAKPKPVTLSSGWSSAPFAFNRRTEQLAAIRPGESLPAPVDHRVPVLRLSRPNGQPLATLFGYACHSTVLTGDTYEINGDYPGYAQQAIEEALPGSTAFFVLLAAGDQRATPRGTLLLAQQHGRTLARAVLDASLSPLPPTLTTAIENIRLPFASHTREAYLAEANSSDVFAARRGKAMLAAIDDRRLPLNTPYPIQALRLGTLTLLALPGEVVVDYALTLRDKYGPNLITAAYASHLPGYIPSLRLQREGGYEAGDAMMYFLQPGWFTDEVEPLVLSAIQRLLARLP